MVFKEVLRYVSTYIVLVSIYLVGATISFALLVWAAFNWLRGSSDLFKTKRRELPPSSLNDPEYGEHFYVHVKNIKLHYVAKGDRTKPLMLMLHGFPEFWYSWRYQIRHFSKHYWTVAVDLRGFGDSEKPCGVSQYKLKYLVNDIKNLLDALGKEKCVLVGHEWGAIIGWYFLLKYPEMIENYVMINMPPIFASGYKFVQLISSWYIYLFQIPYVPEFCLSLNDYQIFNKIFRRCNSTDKEAYKFIFGKPGSFTFPLNYYRANILRLAFPYKEKAEDVKFAKGLVIYTENDKFIHVANFKDITSSIENLQISFIESGSHFVHQQKHEDVNKVMSKFLQVQLGQNSDDPGEGKSMQSTATVS